MMDTKIKVVLGQLGSPKSPSVKDVRIFLKEFLGDPRVVDLPRWLWAIILNLFVLPFRPAKSAKAYSRIWDKDGFPLVKITESLAHKLMAKLDPRLELNHAFLLSYPRIEDLFKIWDKEDPFKRAQKVIVLPQFPQYAESTIGSVVDVLGHSLNKRVNIPSLEILSSFHRSKVFIDHSVKLILETLKVNSSDVLVISFHGIPTRRVVSKKDIYFQHCLETFELLKTEIQKKISIPTEITFQSRFGSEVWLGPATDHTVLKLVESGKKKIAMYCASFTVDCLETIDEMGNELRDEIKDAGGELFLVPCMNDRDEWVTDYANFINTFALGSQADKDALFYPVNIQDQYHLRIKQQEDLMTPEIPAQNKKVLKMMFLTMFLDLMGFSIIFPMFPQMAKYYLQYDSMNPYLQSIFSFISSIQEVGGLGFNEISMSTIVLFGGLMGALYSLLQFIAAPIWGKVSDIVGRKPVLVISLLGLFISYVIWFFSGNFTLLFIARGLGGLMSGNLSIASAVVADVTDAKNRSKGMAVIGIAFALGFILGPAIGGISTLFNLVSWSPALGILGVNPFSTAALVAATLTLINLIFVFFFFPETLPKEKRGQNTGLHRTLNIFKLFQPLPYQGANRTNIAYFFFITAFAGMEFTLTFLAVERFQNTTMDNAYMFICIGLMIGLIQGGYVRRKANLVGENKMAIQGILILIPGLILLALAQTQWLLYVGLFFLATGSAMIIPCMTSLVSLFTPEDQQGHALGIFRSLGSLGRVFGPILASLLYWRFGGKVSYLVGAVLMVLPLLVMRTLPPLVKNSSNAK